MNGKPAETRKDTRQMKAILIAIALAFAGISAASAFQLVIWEVEPT